MAKDVEMCFSVSVAVLPQETCLDTCHGQKSINSLRSREWELPLVLEVLVKEILQASGELLSVEQKACCLIYYGLHMYSGRHVLFG